MRTNKYKEIILDLLKKHHLLTVAEIHKAVKVADYSTVFRNIEILLKERLIKKVELGNKKVSYEVEHKKHDHFICNDCGRVESIIVPRNFIKGKKVDDITVRGSCGECA